MKDESLELVFRESARLSAVLAHDCLKLDLNGFDGSVFGVNTAMWLLANTLVTSEIVAGQRPTDEDILEIIHNLEKTLGPAVRAHWEERDKLPLVERDAMDAVMMANIHRIATGDDE